MKLITPVKINENIFDLCNEIDPTTKPIFVEVSPSKDAILNDCYGNVENYVRENGERFSMVGLSGKSLNFLLKLNFMQYGLILKVVI